MSNAWIQQATGPSSLISLADHAAIFASRRQRAAIRSNANADASHLIPNGPPYENQAPISPGSWHTEAQKRLKLYYGGAVVCTPYEPFVLNVLVRCASIDRAARLLKEP